MVESVGREDDTTVPHNYSYTVASFLQLYSVVQYGPVDNKL